MISKSPFSTLSLFAVLASTPLTAADFSFFSIVRAGVQGGADWEIGTGLNGNVITTGAHVTWPNEVDRSFRIGYIQSTNTAYTTVWTPSGTPGGLPTASTSAYNPAGGFPLSSSGVWTITAGAMYASAGSITQSRSVQVSNLQLGNGQPGNGLNILQPLASTSLYASQPSATTIVRNTTPIVFSAAASGGDWYLDGSIRFSGLASYVTNGATRSQLQFALTAVAADNPEPATTVLIASGLFAMAYWKRRRRGVQS